MSADIQPTVGTPLAVGSFVSRVVLHLANGFAVQFFQLQDIDDLKKTSSSLSMNALDADRRHTRD